MSAKSSSSLQLFHGHFSEEDWLAGRALARSGKVRLVASGRRHLQASVHAPGSNAPCLVLLSLEKRDSLGKGNLRADCLCEERSGQRLCKHIAATIQSSHALTGLQELLDATSQLLTPKDSDELDAPEAPPSAAFPAAKDAPRATWQQTLSRIKRVAGGDAAGRDSLGAQSEIVFVFDPTEILEVGKVVLHLGTRRRKRTGEWSTIHAKSVGRGDLAEMQDPLDRRIFETLFGAEAVDWSSLRFEKHKSFTLNDSLIQTLVPLLAKTGRFVFSSGGSGQIQQWIHWDDAEPWELRFRLEAVAGAEDCRLVGFFARGTSELPLHDPLLILASGIVFHAGKAAWFRHHGSFEWIVQLRRDRELRVPAMELVPFRRQFYDLPDSPAIEWPEALKLEEHVVEPRPRLRIVHAGLEDPIEGRDVRAMLWFDYGGTLVHCRDSRALILAHDSDQLLRRQWAVEEASANTLQSLGLHPIEPQLSRLLGDHDFELTAEDLSRVVAALLESGWMVEAEGALYRPPGSLDISVSSGIDWFEVGGGAQFGDQLLPFPRLLEALQKRRHFVILDDGTRGLLPDEWLTRMSTWMGSGEAGTETVRYRMSQAMLLEALLEKAEHATCDEAFERLRANLRDLRIQPQKAPPGFHGTLRPYQEMGLGWMRLLQSLGFGGCLADDMGLGKTVQVLALLEERRTTQSAPSLVVVPKSLVFNWKSEAQRFAPGLKVCEHTGSQRDHQTDAFRDANMVITTYGTLRSDIWFLKDLSFDYVILDEAPAIKNPNTATAKAVRLLKTKHKLALSGTPIENHLGELWSLFEFLNPGMLGRASVFKEAIQDGGDASEERLKELGRALRPFLLRRTKEQVMRDLPPKTEQTIFCELEPKERSYYDELREHYRRALLHSLSDEALERSQVQVLEALLRLRQASCHPGLIDDSLRSEPSTKLSLLLEHLREILEEGHKVLVFSQFTSLLGILREFLLKEQITYEYLDGQTSDRGARVERFQSDPSCKLFLISLKAGGLGLNLTAAEYVFLLDPWWNPAAEAQAIDRTHRIGQTRPVFAYRIVARDTVEEKVLELQKKKRRLADSILAAEKSLLQELKREDLELLLS